MKVLLINSVCGIRSTGRICTDIADELEAQGHEVKIAYGRENVPEQYEKYAVRIGSDFDAKLHALYTRICDKHGFGSVKATREFLKWADEFSPELLWLHNIHGYYINIQLLFDWIKKHPNMRVRWTLHDCWAFTGHCTHFVKAGCNKWLVQCENCPQKKSYPTSYFIDNSKSNYILKKQLFTGVKNLTVITPSEWLASMVNKSFLNEYPIEVHNNKIDIETFKPTQSDFRLKYRLQNTQIILGVASAWGEYKGLYDFYKLSEILDPDKRIVLVGLSKKQLKTLPKSIIGIEKTNSKTELAEIYTAADIFFNPTYEDTYPTVNLEAEACGTKVITYNTGGAPETIKRGDSVVIPQGEYKRVLEIIDNE